jgi:hypothetical protein
MQAGSKNIQFLQDGICEDLLEFASIKLRKNVTDLEKLSVNDLDTLYNRVFGLKK